MVTEKTDKGPGKNFIDIFDKFGSALSEIFNDPELKAKAREFGKSAGRSADALASRFRDEEVKARWREVGQAAQDFGKSIAEQFKPTQNPASENSADGNPIAPDGA
ncbi:MAG: hypothetical protein FWH51_06040 [Dehalococcoidia bacterium]|nr:hypothetical protein [Dehalococcoidia bacterium]